MKEKKLILNRWLTPDNTELISRHRHNFVSHIDKVTKQEYFIDGGTSYCRVSNPDGKMVDCCLYDDAPFERLRKALKWGTRGKSGKDKPKLIAISELTTDHIQAILENADMIHPKYKEVMEEELIHREIIHRNPEAPTIVEVIQELKLHNDWRRGEAGEMTDPTRLGIIIDTAIKLLKQYKRNE